MATLRGPSEPFTQPMVHDLRRILKTSGRYRDLTLLEVHLSTCLRGCDVLALKVGDIRAELTVRQKKTKKRVKCYLGPEALDAFKRYMATRPCATKEDWAFPGYNGASLSALHYGVLIKDWIALLRQSSPKWRSTLDPLHYGTHSIRNTLPTHVYAKTGKTVVCMHMLGHATEKETVRYLGIDETKAREIAAQYPI